MKVTDLKKTFLKKLTPLYDAMEAEKFFHMLIEEYHQKKRVDLALNPDMEFSTEELLRYNLALAQLEQCIPIQYIIGKTYFFGMELLVNSNVLIPRPETEELVQWILDENQRAKLNILDIGTGSGCIAISLAKNLGNATVSAIDVSEAALETAKANARHNEVAINFELLNILSTDQLNQKLDIIVSNPPYVRMLEKAEMHKNVLNHEPSLALFVEDGNALLFYEKIARLALGSLVKGGKLYFEINQYLAVEMIGMLTQKGFSNIEVRKDMFGNDRICRAVLM